MIAKYMAQFIARAVADKLLPLAFIADGFAHLVDASSVTATKMAVEVLEALSEDVEHRRDRAAATARSTSRNCCRHRRGRAHRRRAAREGGARLRGRARRGERARAAAAAGRRCSRWTHLVAELKKEPPADTEALGEWLRSQTIDAAAALAARAIMKCVLETARGPVQDDAILTAIMNRAKLLRSRHSPTAPTRGGERCRPTVLGGAGVLPPTAGRPADQEDPSQLCEKRRLRGRFPALEDLVDANEALWQSVLHLARNCRRGGRGRRG